MLKTFHPSEASPHLPQVANNVVAYEIFKKKQPTTTQFISLLNSGKSPQQRHAIVWLNDGCFACLHEINGVFGKTGMSSRMVLWRNDRKTCVCLRADSLSSKQQGMGVLLTLSGKRTYSSIDVVNDKDAMDSPLSKSFLEQDIRTIRNKITIWHANFSPEESRALVARRKIRLASCRFEDEGDSFVTAFLSHFSLCKRLYSLDLNQTPLSDDSLQRLLQSLVDASFTKEVMVLESLSFHSMNLNRKTNQLLAKICTRKLAVSTKYYAEIVGATTFDGPKPRQLELTCDEPTNGCEKSIEALYDCLTLHFNLTHLSVEVSTAKDVEAFAQGLCRNQTLTDLCVAISSAEVSGVRRILRALAGHPTITTLTIKEGNRKFSLNEEDRILNTVHLADLLSKNSGIVCLDGMSTGAIAVSSIFALATWENRVISQIQLNRMKYGLSHPCIIPQVLSAGAKNPSTLFSYLRKHWESVGSLAEPRRVEL